eukprot:3319095-Amphidinium_carterae.1
MPPGAGPFVQPANSGDIDVTNAGVGGGTLPAAALEIMAEKANIDLRHAATVGDAKLSGDHTLGGSDSHLSGVVEKVALSNGEITDAAAFRWNPASNAGAGQGSRSNTTGDRP